MNSKNKVNNLLHSKIRPLELEFQKNSIILNYQQEQLVQALYSLQSYLNKNKIIRYFYRYPQQGIYIHGNVGSGKTSITKIFYQSLTFPALYIHYHSLIKNLHSALHILNQQKQTSDIKIKTIASQYAQKYRLIFIDEFYINDITDALLLGNFIKWIIKFQIYIIFTSNSAPDNLYQDGLKRELFLPYISMLKQNFEIFHLHSTIDYRYIKPPSTQNRIIIGDKSQQEIERIIKTLTHNNQLKSIDLSIFGRTLHLTHCYKNILVISFQELCYQPKSYNDYITICKFFAIIVLKDVNTVQNSDKDIIIRFINFIDNVYTHRVLLYLNSPLPLEQIYKYNNYPAYERAISRINEMNSKEYFQQSKYKN